MLLSCGVVAAPQNPNSLVFHEYLYAVVLNQQDTNQVSHVLIDQAGDIWLSQNDLVQWRINLPPIQAQTYLGNRYFRLRDIHTGTKIKIDAGLGKIYIDVPSSTFTPSSLDFSTNEIVTPKRSPTVGSFLNYDFFLQKLNSNNPDNAKIAPLTNGGFEWGVFNGFGTIINTANLQNIGGADSASKQNNFVRLNSTWYYDNPAKMTTIRFGDNMSSSGMWGTSVNFGGIQYSNNFSTQPNFQKMPLPSVKGEAVMPSVVDIYVNDSLIGNRDVQSGPFTITNIPVTDGSGNVKLVVKDSLGRQQLINLPYYSSSNILKQSLHDFSIEAGFIRKNYSISSGDYGRFIFSATDTYGLSDSFNPQIHTELAQNVQDLGIGANFVAFKYFDVGTALAGSNSNDIHRTGMLGLVRIGHSSTKINYGLTSQYTHKNFTPLAFSTYQQTSVTDLQNRQRWQHMAFVGFPNVFGGSLGVNYARTTNWNNNSTSLVTASYSHTIFNRVSCSINGTTNVGGTSKTKQVYLNLSLLLGTDTNISTSVNKDFETKNQQLTTTISKSLPEGTGYGYRVTASAGNSNNKFILGGLDLQNNMGTYRFEAAQHQGSKPSYQANISGAITALQGQLFLSRRINNSFGVVKVPGFANVPVSLENQEVAKTNKKGYAFIPDLLPYIKNHISVDPQNLPLSTQIVNTGVEMIPFYRSGVYQEFDVARSNNALITAKLPNGKYVPTGAGAMIEGMHDELFVGENGTIFLMGLKADAINKVLVNWDDISCEIAVPYKTTTDPLPNLGEFVCKFAQVPN